MGFDYYQSVIKTVYQVFVCVCVCVCVGCVWGVCAYVYAIKRGHIHEFQP